MSKEKGYKYDGWRANLRDKRTRILGSATHGGNASLKDCNFSQKVNIRH
jgi:hypothetical protein